MRSAHAVVAADPVLAAGIGVRRGMHWAVRSASFRVGPPMPGKSALGVLIADSGPASALIDVLAGALKPAYGELRVLGHDMTTASGRAAVRSRVGVARRQARPLPGLRVRGLVEHAARLAGPDGGDRRVLAAYILDRLALSPWAEVPVRLAPESVGRRARLAAAAVHQPELLLLDGLLDGLATRDAAVLADAISDLSRDAGILVAGAGASLLALACDDVMVLADGVLMGSDRYEEIVRLS
jgi:ABC-type multidrug transport system ATPase subunit